MYSVVDPQEPSAKQEPTNLVKSQKMAVVHGCTSTSADVYVEYNDLKLT